MAFFIPKFPTNHSPKSSPELFRLHELGNQSLLPMKNTSNQSNQIILMNSEQLQELIQEIHEVKALIGAKSSNQTFPELLRTSEVRRLLKIGESTLSGLRQNGSLPYTKIGGSIYYLKRDIEKIIFENYSGL